LPPRNRRLEIANRCLEIGIVPGHARGLGLLLERFESCPDREREFATRGQEVGADCWGLPKEPEGASGWRYFFHRLRRVFP
jgi:hypothetical protein